MPKIALPWSGYSPAQIQFLTEISSSFLRRINWNQLHNSSDRHAYETDENAGDPLLEWERGSVCKIAKKLYDGELEDDGATEDGNEHVVVQNSIRYVYPLHLSWANRIEYLLGHVQKTFS